MLGNQLSDGVARKPASDLSLEKRTAHFAPSSGTVRDGSLHQEGPVLPSGPDARLCGPPGLKDGLWNRLLRYQGREFFTVTGKSFTFALEGDRGVWFYRNGRRILNLILREEVERAAEHCPVSKPSDLGARLGSSYLFGLLMDDRIRQGSW